MIEQDQADACPLDDVASDTAQYTALLGDDDEWEDEAMYSEMLEQMPSGWYMIKISDFNQQKLLEIDEWCTLNCHAAYKRVGWTSGCAYSVAMQLADSREAVHFRLMWG
jgi:hypothetical protein